MKPAPTFAALLLAAVAVATRAAETPRITQDRVVQALVRDLGAERHDVREKANEALRLIGQPALAALEKAAESDDPEIRLRARDLLADVRLGIGPDWPSEIVLLIRHYDDLQQHERTNAIYRISTLGAKAVPFLVRRMETGSQNEANYAFNMLQQRANTDDVCQEIIRLLKEPKNDLQARALSWARAQRGQALEGIEAIAIRQPAELKPNKAAEAALQEIVAKLKQGKAQDALSAAEALAKADPADSRPLYLQAEALIPLNRDKEALALREKALALSPDKEAPHYLAAELLTRLGRYRLAVKEWQRVVEIEPAGSVLDTNAHLSLAAIHTANGLFEPAAQYLDKALQIILKQKDEEKIKGVAAALQMEIDRLRQRASSYAVSAEAAVEDAIPASEIKIDVKVAPKEGKAEDLARAVASSAAAYQINVQVPGVAIFDLPSTSLKFDKDKKQILVLFHGEPACEPLPFEPKAANPQIAIHAGGCTYIFKVDAATGAVERLAKFEKTYTVTLKPGLKIASFAAQALRINGQPFEWQKALAGLPFDRLPEQFDIIIEGTAPLGRRMTFRVSLDAVEPAPEAPTPAPEPPAKPKA